MLSQRDLQIPLLGSALITATLNSSIYHQNPTTSASSCTSPNMQARRSTSRSRSPPRSRNTSPSDQARKLQADVTAAEAKVADLGLKSGKDAFINALVGRYASREYDITAANIQRLSALGTSRNIAQSTELAKAKQDKRYYDAKIREATAKAEQDLQAAKQARDAYTSVRVSRAMGF